jgi:hypothetical protein
MIRTVGMMIGGLLLLIVACPLHAWRRSAMPITKPPRWNPDTRRHGALPAPDSGNEARKKYLPR